MDLKVLVAWLRQPTSVAGLSAIMATISGLATHQLSITQALPLLVGGVVSIVLPDNTAAKSDAESLTGELLGALAKHRGEGK
jgi:hypothetical protein